MSVERDSGSLCRELESVCSERKSDKERERVRVRVCVCVGRERKIESVER